MGRSAVHGASITACLTLAACSANHYVQRGADLYGEGRFVEADEVFERSEPRLAKASLEQRAEYATYRGATFIALGDLQHAQHWLAMATQIEREHPGTLRPSESAFLDGEWRALASRLPPSPPPATTAIASSSQLPSSSVENVPPSPPPQRRSLVPQ